VPITLEVMFIIPDADVVVTLQKSYLGAEGRRANKRVTH